MFINTRLLALPGLLLLLVGLACPGGSEPGSFAGLLEVIPDTPGTRQAVWMNDISHLPEQFNVAIPPSDADQDAVLNYLWEIRFKGASDRSEGYAVMAEPPFINGFQERGHLPESLGRRDYLGFDLRNVDQTMLVPRTFYPTAQIKPESPSTRVARCRWRSLEDALTAKPLTKPLLPATKIVPWY